MKRFYVAVEAADGGVILHPMKEWFRQNPSALPEGFIPDRDTTSHQFRRALRRAGWSVEESEAEVRLFRPGHTIDPADLEDEMGGEDDGEENASEQAFALEYQLRDFLADNLGQMEIAGRSVRLYVDLEGRDGIEYPTGVGPIDILGVDDTGAFVVFELKRARSADRAMGQLTRYMGWVKHTIGRDREVRGVIVARTIDTRLRYAAMIVPDVTLLEYKVNFTLHDASGLPASS